MSDILLTDDILLNVKHFSLNESISSLNVLSITNMEWILEVFVYKWGKKKYPRIFLNISEMFIIKFKKNTHWLLLNCGI